jgi:hypothetical protein
LPIHNNMSELALRREAVGRKNWIFVGSDDGGAGWWLTHRDEAVDASQFATYAAVKTQEPRAMDATALRERGQKARDEGAWSACEHDLAAAAEMDPQGVTSDLWKMREKAADRQFCFDATGETDEDNAKPGR